MGDAGRPIHLAGGMELESPCLGSSTLVRTDSGISATYRTEGLPSGQAITMWFVVFNNLRHAKTTRAASWICCSTLTRGVISCWERAR